MAVGGFPRLLRVLSPGAAALLLVVAVWQAPHTVHHLLEERTDGERCPAAASAERAQATAPDVVVLVPVDGAVLGAILAQQPAVSAAPTAPSPARGPPLFAV